MKQWVKKLIDGLDFGKEEVPQTVQKDMSEEKATLLFMLDTYSKYLFEIGKVPVRQARDKFDSFAKQIVSSSPAELEKVLFELRQYYSGYRLDESTYVQSSFEDFKKIIWEFADHLGEDQAIESAQDQALSEKLKDLREAVEANSIDSLRSHAKSFINTYVTIQNQKTERKTKKLGSVRKNLNNVKKKLLNAQKELVTDHLTGANNRRYFEEMAKSHFDYFQASQAPVTMMIVDIDHFKKINDTHGHDIGDFVLQECVQLLRTIFNREEDVVARIGGEEFVILMPGFDAQGAVKRAEDAQARIRKEAFITGNVQIKFTVSMGIAQLATNESISEWLKRADLALYQSKNTGRDKYTVAAIVPKVNNVA